MGTYKQGILGPFSGKVGQVVGSFWRGVAYMRSLAPNIHNPQTTAQMEVRGKFAVTSRTLSPFLVPVRAGFHPRSGNSEWGEAVSLNMPLVTTEVGTGAYVLPLPAILLTNGAAGFDIDVVKNREGGYDATWTPVDGDSTLDGGQVYCVAYNAANNMAETFRSEMSAGSLTFSAAGITIGTGDDFHIYAFASSKTDSSATHHYTFE
jgi:hypothetical protein